MKKLLSFAVVIIVLLSSVGFLVACTQEPTRVTLTNENIEDYVKIQTRYSAPSWVTYQITDDTHTHYRAYVSCRVIVRSIGSNTFKNATFEVNLFDIPWGNGSVYFYLPDKSYVNNEVIAEDEVVFKSKFVFGDNESPDSHEEFNPPSSSSVSYGFSGVRGTVLIP